jgi:ketopantoate reductase
MVVIGAGRVGLALSERAAAHGLPCALVTRTENWGVLQGPPGDPVVLAVRNDDLAELIDRVPVWRRDDLVFVQNGAVRGWLASRGLSQCTRGLLFFAVATRGAAIEAGPPSPFCGPHAGAMVRILTTMGLPAQFAHWPQFTSLELEKMLWIAVFGLLCQRFDATVGEVVENHYDAIVGLTQELSAVGRASMGVDRPAARWVDALVAYSMTIPNYKGSVKEWPWRNGWFVAEATRYRKACPLHETILAAAGFGNELASST